MKDIAVLIIAFSVIAFILIYVIIMCFGDFLKPKLLKKIKVKQNGIEITLTPSEYRKYVEEQNRKAEEQKAIEKENAKIAHEAFLRKNQELNDNISVTINNCNDIVVKKVLETILAITPENEVAFETKEWLFNNGYLHTNEEVNAREKDIYNAKHRETYDAERHLVTFLASIISFVVAFGLSILALPSDLDELKFIIAIWLGLIGALVGSVIGHTINIANAEDYGLPLSHPSVEKERIARGIDIAGVAIGSASAIKNAKNAAKDITNVDGWKEFK